MTQNKPFLLLQLCCLSICAGCIATTANSTPTAASTLTPVPYVLLQQYHDNPSPKPDFISDFRYGVFGQDYDKYVCIYIGHKPIWVEGNFASDIHDSIRRSSIIWIDGQPSQVEISESMTEISIQESNGTISGSFGTTIVCTKVTGIAKGLHIAKIEFRNTTGLLFSYEQVFDVQD